MAAYIPIAKARGLTPLFDKAKLDSLGENIIIDEYDGGCAFTDIGYLGLTTKNAVISFEHLREDYSGEYATLPGYENMYVNNQIYVQMTLPGSNTTRTIVLNDKVATQNQNGYMSAYDKKKLDGITIENGKLKIISGGQTYYFTPTT